MSFQRTTIEERSKAKRAREADVQLGRAVLNEYVLRMARSGRAGDLPQWARERVLMLRGVR